MWLSLRLVNNEPDFISANLPSLFSLKQDSWVSQFLSVRSLIFKADLSKMIPDLKKTKFLDIFTGFLWAKHFQVNSLFGHSLFYIYSKKKKKLLYLECKRLRNAFVNKWKAKNNNCLNSHIRLIWFQPNVYIVIYLHSNGNVGTVCEQ